MADLFDRQATSPACCPGFAVFCEFIAFLTAATALAGSLYLSVGMQLVACPLCLYERTFLMGVVTVLGVSWFLPWLRRSGAAARLSLPLAVAGLGVAGFHVRLEMTETLVCPTGLFVEQLTIPQQSLGAYGVVTLLLLLAVFGTSAASVLVRGLSWLVPAAGLGALLAWGAILSGPPLPKAEKTLAEARSLQAAQELKGCIPIKAAE